MRKTKATINGGAMAAIERVITERDVLDAARGLETAVQKAELRKALWPSAAGVREDRK